MDFTRCTWHPQVNGAKEVLVSTQTVCFLFLWAEHLLQIFKPKVPLPGSVSQLLNKNIQKRFHGKAASGEPGTCDGSWEPTRYLHLFRGLLQGWGTALWRSCRPGSAPTEGLLLGFGGGATKSNQVLASKVPLSSSAVLIVICMLFPGFFAAICGCRQKNSKGFLG